MPLAEAHGIAILGGNHADEAVAHRERNGQKALRVAQPGQRDLRLQRPGPCNGLATDRPAVAQVAFEARHTQKAALAGDRADQPLADGDLGADAALAVAPRGHRDEPLAPIVQEQHARVREVKVVVERLQHDVEQRVEIGRTVDPVRDELQPPHLRPVPFERGFGHIRGRAREEPFDELHRLNLEHIGRDQAEDPRHPRVRRDGVDAQAHHVEQRAAPFRPKELEPQPVGLHGQRIAGLDAGVRVFVEVAAGLVEELTREGHVSVVDGVDLAQVRDVRKALSVARRDDARHDALKASRQGGQRHRRVHRTRVPALGPGV